MITNALIYWGLMPTSYQMFGILVLASPMLGACQQRQTPPPSAGAAVSINAESLPPAPDGAAESLLVDVQSVDSTIRVDVRYAGANNFTGARLPGYDAPRALLRREVAVALGRVQARLVRHLFRGGPHGQCCRPRAPLSPASGACHGIGGFYQLREGMVAFQLPGSGRGALR